VGVRGRLSAALVLVGLGLSIIPASAGPVEAEPGAVSAYFFGDSLMGGTGVTPKRPVMARIAAARLGWDVEVDAWGGTGYTTTGRAPGYLDRLRLPGALAGEYDVVLLEGGTNDARSADDPEHVRRSVEAVVEEVRQRQPQAQIVLDGRLRPAASRSLRPSPAGGRRDRRRGRRGAGPALLQPAVGGLDAGAAAVVPAPDRLHPNARGYGVMGAHLAAELAELELPAGTASEGTGTAAPARPAAR
jgi:acyl-CoA thioesterase-1